MASGLPTNEGTRDLNERVRDAVVFNALCFSFLFVEYYDRSRTKREKKMNVEREEMEWRGGIRPQLNVFV